MIRLNLKTRSYWYVQPWLRPAPCLVALVCLAGVVVLLLPRRAPKRAQDSQAAGPRGPSVTQSDTPQRPAPASPVQTGQPPPALPSIFPQPTLAARQLVNSLINPVSTGGAMTPEHIAAWKQRLQQLIQLGADGVPAIREFLGANRDFEFSEDLRSKLGHASARTAMLDALERIGGSLAVGALGEVLQTTADPREIGLLAQHLEKLEPGVHQSEALEAARQTLAMAGAGNLPERDVAALFELLEQYGGADAVADLKRSAPQWNYYAAIALSQLPDGAGVPSLIEMAAGPEGGGVKAAALLTLTQMAAQSPDARAALIQQARLNQLSASSWASLMPMLAGDQIVFQNTASDNSLSGLSPTDLRQTHISLGNQNFFTAPLGARTVEQINQLQSLITELLAVTSDPAGRDALQQAKARLEQRLLPLTAASGK